MAQQASVDGIDGAIINSPNLNELVFVWQSNR